MPDWILVHGSEVPMSDEVAGRPREGLHSAETGRNLLDRIRDIAGRGENQIELSDDEADLVGEALSLKLDPSISDEVRDGINRIRNDL